MVSHHGRESGYCVDIFKAKPRLCIISDGRVQKTDATARYSGHATGWKVHNRNGSESQKRNCLTTRSDGYVDIKIGKNSNNKRYLSVTID